MIHSLWKRIERLEEMSAEKKPGVTFLFTYLDHHGNLHEDVDLASSPWTRAPLKTADSGTPWQD